MPIQAVLFDLDGTLLDTAPDLVTALNQMRAAESLPPMPLSEIRQIANLGSKAMIKLALGMEECDPRFKRMREHFFHLYEKHLADATQFFPQVERLLTTLDEQSIRWGIVTNKLTRHAEPLLKALKFDHRPACLVCGDSVAKGKPDPLPIKHACELLKVLPENCIYVGDAASDVVASKAAGVLSIVALYGYIHADDDPKLWNADGYIDEPMQVVKWLNS
jgi:2-phosphoglycolate phosphatase